MHLNTQQEWELYLKVLEQIAIEDVRLHLVEHKWEVQSHNDPRVQVYVKGRMLLFLPVDTELTDFYNLFDQAIRVIAVDENMAIRQRGWFLALRPLLVSPFHVICRIAENIWYPYLVQILSGKL